MRGPYYDSGPTVVFNETFSSSLASLLSRIEMEEGGKSLRKLVWRNVRAGGRGMVP